MDVATAIMSIRVSTDQCLMAGKMILHKFKSQGLCFLASKMVFVFIARIKTDDIVMGLDFVVSVVFSILVIEHFALKIKGVGIAVYSIDKMKDEDQTRASGNLLNNTQLAWLAAAQIARDKGYECAALMVEFSVWCSGL